MNATAKFFLFAASLTLGLQSASADSFPKLVEKVNLAPEHVFVPQGFDDNDEAEITIAGSFPNTCYRSGKATAQVDRTAKTIVIKNEDNFFTSCWCLFVLVPYVKTIPVGMLPTGTYTVLVEQTNGERIRQSSLSVAVSANNGPDDYLYPLVEDAKVETQGEGKPAKLTLSGQLPSECMELDEVRVAYRAPNVIEVLPIAKIENEADCGQKKREFRKEVLLSPPWKGATLVHIRSLNGQALNKVATF